MKALSNLDGFYEFLYWYGGITLEAKLTDLEEGVNELWLLLEKERSRTINRD